MPHDHPPDQSLPPVGKSPSFKHERQRGTDTIGIIRAAHPVLRQLPGECLQVGEIDIDPAVQKLEVPGSLESRGIPDNREGKPLIAGGFDGLCQGGCKVGTRHNINVGSTLPLKTQHDFREFIGRNGRTRLSAAQLTVLAVAAAEGTA